MLIPENQARLAEERRRLAAYLEAPTEKFHVIDRNDDAYEMACVVFPSLLSYLGIALRYMMAGLAAISPSFRLRTAVYRWMGMKIGRGSFIAPLAMLDPFYPRLIEIEDDVFLGMGCKIMTHEYSATNFRAGRVRIGRGSVIGAYALVRSGVDIGCKVTVGFQSYVNKDVADGTTVGGVPARNLKSNPVAG